MAKRRLIDRWRGSELATAITGYTSERLLRLLLLAAVGIFVARYLGPERLGLLTYVSSVFALLGSFTLLGMRPILVREFSTQEDWQEILVAALARQLPVALLVSAASLIVIAATRHATGEALLIAFAMLPLPFLSVADSLQALLEASGRVRAIVLTSVVAVVLSSSLKVAAILVAAPTWVFAAIATTDSALVAFG